MSLVLVSSAANAGLFSKKKPAPPPPPEPAPVVLPPPPPPPPIPLEFSGIQTAPPMNASLDRIKSASAEVQMTAEWIAASKDNGGMPFYLVDKVNAQVYAFTPAAQLKATAPILLGMGTGDVALVPQDAPMSAMPPAKRITPAGRYPSKLVIDPHGKVVLMIDGPNLISMHIVAKGTPAQRRAERLASVTSDDNRISFGCINVPPAFFTEVVDPDFRRARGIVYILPEKITAAQQFGFQAPTNGALALQTALGGTEASVPPSTATSLQLQLQPAATTAPLQTSLPATASPAPLQTSLQPAMPIQAPQPAPVNLGDTTPVSAPDSK